MRMAVLGAAGQLGRDLVARLPGEVLPLGRSDIDLSRPETILPKLQELQPQVFINCAAYNLVDQAEREPEVAFAANTWGVRELAKVCSTLKIKLVHFSSDYVFGLSDSPLSPKRETDAPGPVSVYGASKLTGEYFVRSLLPQHLVIRTCGLYGVWGSGGKGGNFVETMLRVAGQGKPLKVVNDQHCTPSYTVDAADAVVRLLAADATGLVHVTNSGACTWYELAAAIFELSGTAADLTPISSAQFAAVAQRPPYSVLNCDRLNAMGISLRPWREALAAYLQERRGKR